MKQSKQNRTLVLSRGIATVKSLTVLIGGFAGLGLGLSGCSSGLGSSAATTVAAPSGKGGIQGTVHGGQQPIIGAKIQLYTVGSTGLGSVATALIPSADQVVYNGSAGTGALTDSGGGFRITGDYTCPTISQQVYLVATGGTSQGAGGSVNSAIALMAPLGDCATLVANASTTSLQINEITTVAAVYALAPFMTGYANVGAASVNNTGLINAVGNFNNLATLSSGAAGGASLPSGATVPTTEINTLANIIASCVNSPLPSASACTTLATATSATDTVGMLLAFAKNPGSSALTALYAQGSASAPFQPAFGTQPNDWTIAIKYTGAGNFLSPYGIAIDAAGDAWVTNTAGSSVIELTPSGAVSATLSGSLIGPKGIAIDKSSNVWVANPSLGTVVKFAGGAGTGTAYTVGTGPVALAIDSAGTAWVANQLSNSISSVTSGGTITSYSTGLSLNGPAGVAIDSTTGSGGGNIYVANSGGGNVVKLTNAGVAASGSPFTDYALQGTLGVGLDASNNVYALGSTTGAFSVASLSQFTSTGTAASYSPVAANTATGVYPGIVVTGVNQVLLTNGATAGALQSLSLSANSKAVSYGSLNAPIGLAVDPSGDVWTANSGDNTVSVFIGLTTPATTPLAANVGP